MYIYIYISSSYHKFFTKPYGFKHMHPNDILYTVQSPLSSILITEVYIVHDSNT